ncbi:hypothetical protein [Mangrovibacter phragmitis]|uniref:hypothetical protein n=1 Tax=Mangrovibacter phragmitis TaxID=1691903 RepID=UPI003511D2E7
MATRGQKQDEHTRHARACRPQRPAASSPGSESDAGDSRCERQGVATASGMETRCPGGAGQRQHRWLCAEHDSPPGRPVSQTGRPPPQQENDGQE